MMNKINLNIFNLNVILEGINNRYNLPSSIAVNEGTIRELIIYNEKEYKYYLEDNQFIDKTDYVDIYDYYIYCEYLYHFQFDINFKFIPGEILEIIQTEYKVYLRFKKSLIFFNVEECLDYVTNIEKLYEKNLTSFKDKLTYLSLLKDLRS